MADYWLDFDMLLPVPASGSEHWQQQPVTTTLDFALKHNSSMVSS